MLNETSGQAKELKLDVTVSNVRSLFECNENTGVVYWKIKPNKRLPVGSVAGWKHSDGYLNFQYCGKLYLTHRIAWLLHYGEWPDQIDHINGVRDDNRICNLRSVPSVLNSRNKATYKNNVSGVVGVSWVARDKRWVAMLGKIRLGAFITKDAAVAARTAAILRDTTYHVNHGR